MAISSLGERYETYMDRIRLNLGRKIGPESEVYVTVKGDSKVVPGVVCYKGEVPPYSSTMFGVELIVSILILKGFTSKHRNLF